MTGSMICSTANETTPGHQRADYAAALQLGDQLPDGQAASSAQTVSDPALATRAPARAKTGRISRNVVGKIRPTRLVVPRRNFDGRLFDSWPRQPTMLWVHCRASWKIK